MALYPYPPSPGVSNQVMPIVYGTFVFDIYNPRLGSGLMKGFPITNQIWHPPMKFAKHALESIDKMYLTGGGLPLECPTIGTVLAAAQVTLTADYVWVWMMPNETGALTYGVDVSTQQNPENGYDGSATTNAGIRDYFDNISQRKFGAGYAFPEDQEGTVSEALMSNAERGYASDVEIIYKVNEVYPHDNRVINLYHAVSPLNELAQSLTPTYDATERTISSSPNAVGVQGRSDRYLLHVYGNLINASYPGNGTINDQIMAAIYRLAVRVKWIFSRRLYAGSNPPETEAWATGSGRAYSTWIDNAGRSNAKNSGDLIDNLSGTIESMLRDELSVTTSLIDEASFDSAIDALGGEFAMQIMERKPAFEYIKQLAEQSYFMFVWTSGGKARLVMLNDSTPITQRTIPFSHIKDGQVRVTRQRPFCNEIKIKSRWHEYYQAYNDDDTVSNSSSITAYGRITYNAEWPNIFNSTAASTTIDDLAAHLVGDSNGILSNPHNVIDFETLGYTNCDLECGDWIELEAASCDPQIKLFGATWSGKQFSVTKIEQMIDSTKITAMQLY